MRYFVMNIVLIDFNRSRDVSVVVDCLSASKNTQRVSNGLW